MYLLDDTMYWANNKRDDVYGSLLDRKSLDLGAVEHVNIAHRVFDMPEITLDEARETASNGNECVDTYWSALVQHGNFWTADQPTGKPNFVEGG